MRWRRAGTRQTNQASDLASAGLAIDEHTRRVAVEDIGHCRATAQLVHMLLCNHRRPSHSA